MDYKTMKFDEIMDWCFANGKEDWLEEKLAEGLSFLKIKEAFVLAFMPSIKPPKKPQSLSMKERFALRKAGK
jgi:hypothetical protein